MAIVALTSFLIGLILMAGEIIVPGGILGTIGAVAFLVASINVWAHFGATWGMIAIVAGMCVGIALFFIEVRFLKSGPLAKWFYLSLKTPPTSSKSAEEVLSGAKGVAVTPLHPSGLVLIGEKRYEALSRDGMIEEGAKIVVVADDPFRIVVSRDPEGK